MSVDDAGGELPTVGTEIAGVMEAGVLLENGDTTDAAGSSDEISGCILKRSVGHGKVRDEDGSTGSLLHPRKAIGDPASSIKSCLIWRYVRMSLKGPAISSYSA